MRCDADTAPRVPPLPFESVTVRGETLVVTFRVAQRRIHVGYNTDGYPQLVQHGNTFTLKRGDRLNVYSEAYRDWTFAFKPRFQPAPPGLAGEATFNPNRGGKDLSKKFVPPATVFVFKRASEQ
jgi:hypothetical protein